MPTQRSPRLRARLGVASESTASTPFPQNGSSKEFRGNLPLRRKMVSPQRPNKSEGSVLYVSVYNKKSHDWGIKAFALDCGHSKTSDVLEPEGEIGFAGFSETLLVFL